MLDNALMKSVLQRYIDGFNADDAEAIVDLFADDATVEDPVGSDPIKGKAAIEQFYRRAVTMNVRLALAAPIRGSHSNAAAMAFDITFSMDGKEVFTRAIDVMEFNNEGKIIRMRAYWGPDDTKVKEG